MLQCIFTSFRSLAFQFFLFIFSIAFVGMLSVFKIRLNFCCCWFSFVVFATQRILFYSIVLMIIYYKRLMHFAFHFLFPCNVQYNAKCIQLDRNDYSRFSSDIIIKVSEKRHVLALINRRHQSFFQITFVLFYYIVLESERCGCFCLCLFWFVNMFPLSFAREREEDSLTILELIS